MSWYSCQKDGAILLKLYVQPRASRNEIAGLHNDALKLRLTTPPVDGKANKAVIAFLAKLFNLPKSSVVLKSGHQNRNKTVVVKGLNEERLLQVLKLGES